MYWIRTDNPLDLFLYLLLTASWAVGGCLLAGNAFHLRRAERLVTGLSAGLLLFITLSNLLANLLPLTPAYWLSAVGILLAGLLAARAALPGQAALPITLTGLKNALRLILSIIQYPLAIAILTVLFTFIHRGLALFDEYLHIPLVSTMAAGDIPPHLYVNPDLRFAYHYGIQVFAASLVRLGGLFPWSAWDASRAAALAFTLVLGYLWVRRMTHFHPGAGLPVGAAHDPFPQGRVAGRAFIWPWRRRTLVIGLAAWALAGMAERGHSNAQYRPGYRLYAGDCLISALGH